jgi:hypothetical protein
MPKNDMPASDNMMARDVAPTVTCEVHFVDLLRVGYARTVQVAQTARCNLGSAVLLSRR